MKLRRFLQGFAFAAALVSLPTVSFSQVSIGIAVNLAPPALPIYEQPICPAPNYIWTPGYWAWNGYDYYWVPGTWVVAPNYGLLWTPGYWGWGTGGYFWHTGYWGPHIGFYGGVNYGFGYYGRGYEGGYWRGNSFYYNSAVSRVNTTVIRNVYVNRTVINNVTVNRVSYNGGRGGIEARASINEESALRERRMGPVNSQLSHQQFAQQDRANFFKNNRGVPAHTAFERPATSVQDYNHNAAAVRPANRPGNEVRPGAPERPAAGVRPAAPERPMTRPAPQQGVRPAAPVQRPAQPINRPSPQQQMRPETRPAPAIQQPRPQLRPQPEARPAPQREPEARPSEPRPEPRGNEHPR